MKRDKFPPSHCTSSNHGLCYGFRSLSARQPSREAPTICYANDIINPTIVDDVDKAPWLLCFFGKIRASSARKIYSVTGFRSEDASLCGTEKIGWAFFVARHSTLRAHWSSKYSDKKRVLCSHEIPKANLQQWQFNFDWWLHQARLCLLKSH